MTASGDRRQRHNGKSQPDEQGQHTERQHMFDLVAWRADRQGGFRSNAITMAKHSANQEIAGKRHGCGRTKAVLACSFTMLSRGDLLRACHLVSRKVQRCRRHGKSASLSNATNRICRSHARASDAPLEVERSDSRVAAPRADRSLAGGTVAKAQRSAPAPADAQKILCADCTLPRPPWRLAAARDFVPVGVATRPQSSRRAVCGMPSKSAGRTHVPGESRARLEHFLTRPWKVDPFCPCVFHVTLAL